MFTSVEKSWNSGLKTTGDYKELIPEFYDSTSFLKNLSEMQAIGFENLGDVELPNWAESAEHFSEVMKEALESDYVSQNLHYWIDLIFGYRQKETDEDGEKFPETCYGINWASFKCNLEKDAFEVICKEFGQCPEQLFFIPHLPRVFRINPSIYPVLDTPHQIPLLEVYLTNLQDLHQQNINTMLDQFNKSKKKLAEIHSLELDDLNLQISQLKEIIKKNTDENNEIEKQKHKEIEIAGILKYQHSHESIKPGKSPVIFTRNHENELRLLQEQEYSKTRIESVKKPRKIQSKTPTKPY